MKLHPTDYAPFIPSMDVMTYCQQHLDPFYEEIEHVGLKALVDAVLSPADIAVECLYLDRSLGDEATLHRFGPDSSQAVIHVLYRP